MSSQTTARNGTQPAKGARGSTSGAREYQSTTPRWGQDADEQEEWSAGTGASAERRASWRRGSPSECQVIIRDWVTFYNEKRPYWVLGFLTPSKHT